MSLEKMFFGVVLAFLAIIAWIVLSSRVVAGNESSSHLSPERAISYVIETQAIPTQRSIAQAEWAQVYWLKRAALAAEQRCAGAPK